MRISTVSLFVYFVFCARNYGAEAYPPWYRGFPPGRPQMGAGQMEQYQVSSTYRPSFGTSIGGSYPSSTMTSKFGDYFIRMARPKSYQGSIFTPSKIKCQFICSYHSPRELIVLFRSILVH